MTIEGYMLAIELPFLFLLSGVYRLWLYRPAARD